MTGDLLYLVGQIAVLLTVGVVLGVLAGRFAWPRRSRVAAPPPDPALVADYEARLRSAQAEAERWRGAVSETADRKDTEMGRLETGAIHALETTIATNTERLAAVEARLKEAEAAARDGEARAADERRRGDRLESALAERDEHVAELRASLAARDGRPD